MVLRGFLPCQIMCVLEKRRILPAPTEGEIPERGGGIITMYFFFFPFILTLNVLALLSEGDGR